MSWQDYVDKQLLASKCVTKAAIAGHDGGVWAKSENFEVSARGRPPRKMADDRPAHSTLFLALHCLLPPIAILYL